MPEPMSPEGPRQPIAPAQPEQLTAPHEIKQFTIKVDGKETRYPENYPFSFIADGAPAAIRRITGGMSPDTEELGHAIHAYLEPSQEIFANAHNLPEWYQQTLVPILERNHLSLTDVKPADTHILGDDFRWALEDIYNFPFPKEAQVQAARSMGQTEGTVPTLSVLIQELRKSDSIRFEELMTTLLKRGPDGFAMAAYLAAPEEEKAGNTEETTEPQLNFDKAVTRDETGRAHINPQAVRDFFDTSWEGLRKGFDKGVTDIDFTPSDKIVHPENYKLNGPKAEE